MQFASHYMSPLLACSFIRDPTSTPLLAAISSIECSAQILLLSTFYHYFFTRQCLLQHNQLAIAVLLLTEKKVFTHTRFIFHNSVWWYADLNYLVFFAVLGYMSSVQGL